MKMALNLKRNFLSKNTKVLFDYQIQFFIFFFGCWIDVKSYIQIKKYKYYHSLFCDICDKKAVLALLLLNDAT